MAMNEAYAVRAKLMSGERWTPKPGVVVALLSGEVAIVNQFVAHLDPRERMTAEGSEPYVWGADRETLLATLRRASDASSIDLLIEPDGESGVVGAPTPAIDTHAWGEPKLYGSFSPADRLLYTCSRCGLGRTEPVGDRNPNDKGGFYGAFAVWNGVSPCGSQTMGALDGATDGLRAPDADVSRRLPPEQADEAGKLARSYRDTEAAAATMGLLGAMSNACNAHSYAMKGSGPNVPPELAQEALRSRDIFLAGQKEATEEAVRHLVNAAAASGALPDGLNLLWAVFGVELDGDAYTRFEFMGVARDEAGALAIARAEKSDASVFTGSRDQYEEKGSDKPEFVIEAIPVHGVDARGKL